MREKDVSSSAPGTAEDLDSGVRRRRPLTPRRADLSKADADKRSVEATKDRLADLQARELARAEARRFEKNDMAPAAVYAGVTQTWLVTAFGMSRETVAKRLSHCPVAHQRANIKHYLLKDAAEYLVTPKLDVAKVLKTMGRKDLPSHLQSEVWQAALLRQKWEENARKLYRAEQVIEFMSELVRFIRNSIKIWPDEIGEVGQLSIEQQQAFENKVDELQGKLYSDLKEWTRSRRTRSSLDEMDHLSKDDKPASSEDYSDVV